MNANNKHYRPASQRKFIILLATIWVSIFFAAGCAVRPETMTAGTVTVAIDSLPAAETPTPPARSASPTSEVFVVNLPTSTQDLNCTYSLNYWAQNPRAWLTDNIIIGRLTYTGADARKILAGDGQEGLRADVLKEFFAAALNVLKGADASVVERELTKASDWLNENPGFDRLSIQEREDGEALFAAISAFNSGETGPGRCADEPLIPTATQTATPSPTTTATRRAGPSLTPSMTRTSRPGSGGPGQPGETETVEPTQDTPATDDNAPPTQSNPPTRTPISNTPRPSPTQAPWPSSTNAPPPTPEKPSPTPPPTTDTPPTATPQPATDPPTATAEPSDPPAGSDPTPDSPSDPTDTPVVIIDLPLLPPIQLP